MMLRVYYNRVGCVQRGFTGQRGAQRPVVLRGWASFGAKNHAFVVRLAYQTITPISPGDGLFPRGILLIIY